MTKVYYAQSIGTQGEFDYSIKVANKIKELGYEVYAPALNNKINDKSNNPTPKDIYSGDVSEIMNSDIFVINLTGGKEDGTLTELGLVAGLNEMSYPIDIIAFTSNQRLGQPQYYQGIPSASANHLALGMIDKWGEFVGSEDNMLKALTKENTQNNFYIIGDIAFDIKQMKEQLIDSKKNIEEIEFDYIYIEPNFKHLEKDMYLLMDDDNSQYDLLIRHSITHYIVMDHFNSKDELKDKMKCYGLKITE